jgi:hypothetical protein
VAANGKAENGKVKMENGKARAIKLVGAKINGGET